jgi:DDE superfamily endonuclease
MVSENLAGGKLPLFIILKGSTTKTSHIQIERHTDYRDGMEFGVHKKAWMDESLMQEDLDARKRIKNISHS